MLEESMMKSIKEWIENCPLLNGGKISVDYLDDDIDSYSIDRTPSNPIVSTDIIGGKIKQIRPSVEGLIVIQNSKFKIQNYTPKAHLNFQL